MKLDFQSMRTFAVFGGVIGASALLLIVSLSRSVRANDTRIVTIFADGQEQSISSSAATVGEVLERAAVQIHQYDRVEPSTDTQINTETFNVNVYRARPVTIIDGEERISTVSAHQSPRSILEAEGVEIFDEDRLTLDRIDDFVSEATLGLKLTIDRATPLILNLYGHEAVVRTQAVTVGEFLKERGIVPTETDIVYPSPETMISQDLRINVIGVNADFMTEELAIPHDQETIYDMTQPVGYRQVQEEGKDGLRLVSYRVTHHNGVEVERVEVQSVTLREPKTATVILGTKTEGFSGDFAAALASLRGCEGSYTSVNAAGYYGAYQFNIGTWSGVAPSGYESIRPDQAPPSIQDQAAANLYKRSGWNPWPACSRSLGLQDIYR